MGSLAMAMIGIICLAPVLSNLLRPVVVPSSSVIRLTARSRSGASVLSVDNRNYSIPDGVEVEVSRAPFKLKKVCLSGDTFIDALKDRLFWGQDVRNTVE